MVEYCALIVTKELRLSPYSGWRFTTMLRSRLVLLAVGLIGRALQVARWLTPVRREFSVVSDHRPVCVTRQSPGSIIPASSRLPVD